VTHTMVDEKAPPTYHLCMMLERIAPKKPSTKFPIRGPLAIVANPLVAPGEAGGESGNRGILYSIDTRELACTPTAPVQLSHVTGQEHWSHIKLR
jgi:hypothetical protein